MRVFLQISKVNESYQLYPHSYVWIIIKHVKEQVKSREKRNKCENKYLICFLLMTSTERFPVPLASNLTRINKIGAFQRELLDWFSVNVMLKY